MKISTVITLIVISSLLFLVRTDSIAVSNSENDMPVFQLMDLTELLKSLNVTYQDLAMNLSTLESLNNLPSPSQLYQNQTNNSPSQTNSVTNKTTTNAVIPSQNTTQDPKTVSTPKVTPPTSNPSSSNPQKSLEPSSAAKPSTSSTQDSKPTKNIQPAAQTSTSSSASMTASSSTSSSNSPTFGPGPDNKSLPPVIDLTKMTVDYVAPASKSTTSLPTTNSSPKTTTPTATQTANQDNNAFSTKSVSPSAVRTNSNNNVNTLNNNSPTQSPSNTQSNPTVSPSTVTPRTQTATVSTQTNDKTTSSIPKTPQTPKNTPAAQPTDKNSVYLSPISAPAKPASGTINSNYQTQQTNQPQSSSNTPAPSTPSSPSASWNSDASVIYNITVAYKSFSPYFIITKNDPYLPSLRTYLLNNYGNYLSQGQIIAGFRVYNDNGDNSLDYQLLYSTFYGTFTTILTYWPDTNRIMLKTLSILNFFIMEIDYANCRTQDLAQQNCKVCNDGYRNFMGRCRALDPFCSKYLSDQCGACSEGKRVLNGQCQ